jgi:hypothetical protein
MEVTSAYLNAIKSCFTTPMIYISAEPFITGMLLAGSSPVLLPLCIINDVGCMVSDYFHQENKMDDKINNKIQLHPVKFTNDSNLESSLEK